MLLFFFVFSVKKLHVNISIAAYTKIQYYIHAVCLMIVRCISFIYRAFDSHIFRCVYKSLGFSCIICQRYNTKRYLKQRLELEPNRNISPYGIHEISVFRSPSTECKITKKEKLM